VVMVGKTGPLDPEKYPVLKEERKMFSNTIGSKTLTVRLSPAHKTKHCMSSSDSLISFFFFG